MMPSAADSASEAKFEIGHVLFLDIVGYSKLLIEEQKERLNQLSAIVLATAQVAKSTDEQLVRLPTGDGMALVFRNSSEEPARCALEIAQALKANPEVLVRMGINSGPVSEVTDVNGRANIAGAGINLAQRVMDCGDAGHILLSQRVAEDLAQYRQWAPRLHDLGDCEVKHGVRLYIFNLYTGELGNCEAPKKLQKAQREAATPASVDRKSLVVLPLANQSGDPEQEYFADGLTEELINRLGRLRSLLVIGRNSSFALKGRREDSRVIGQTVGVAHLLEGSVRKAGDRVRISVGLVRAADGSQLWTQSYDRELRDIFAVQEEIATSIADQLRLTILGEVETSSPLRRDENSATLECYRLYLRGRYHWAKRTEAGLHSAIEHFKQAIDLDPASARSWAGLADCYAVLGCWGYEPPRQSYPKAKAAAEKALSLDETLSEAHTSLAVTLKDYYWDWAGAEQAYRRALELNPSNVTARQWYAELLACVGRHEEAIRECEEARSLDPLSLIVAVTLGRHGYCFARQYSRAIKELQDIVRTDPDFWIAHTFLGFAYLANDQTSQALAAFENAHKLEQNGDILAGIGCALARLNRSAEARQVLAELEKLWQKQFAQPVVLALVHIGLGEKEEAFLCLEKAFEEHAQWLSEIKVDPAFDSLRSDARFGELLQRMGLA